MSKHRLFVLRIPAKVLDSLETVREKLHMH